MNPFEYLKIETDYGITFKSAGMLHATGAPVMGREYYYPAEIPENILKAFKEQAAELTSLGVNEVLFRLELAGNNPNGPKFLVFEAELGPQWEERLSSKTQASGSRARVGHLFGLIKNGLHRLGHSKFDSTLKAPNKERKDNEQQAETWYARLWCNSAEFPGIM